MLASKKALGAKQNGININIDRYNEKRQAKMAKYVQNKNQLILNNKPIISQPQAE